MNHNINSKFLQYVPLIHLVFCHFLLTALSECIITGNLFTWNHYCFVLFCFHLQTVSILEQRLTMTENKLRECLDNQQKISLQIRPNEWCALAIYFLTGNLKNWVVLLNTQLQNVRVSHSTVNPWYSNHHQIYSQSVKLSRVIFSFLSSSLLELDRSTTMQNRRFWWKTHDKNNVSKYAYRDSLIADI